MKNWLMNFARYPACSRNEFFIKYPRWEDADLPGAYQRVITLYYVEKCSYAEIDRRMGFASKCAQRWRNKAVYLLDVYHGYVEKEN